MNLNKNETINDEIEIPYNDIFIIIPAYNEEKKILDVIDDLQKKGYCKIVVIDDGSCDKTYEVLKNSKIFLLKHKINLGQGATLQTGIEFAINKFAKYIVTFDADGQHSVDDIKTLIIPLITKNYDISLGSRFLRKNDATNIAIFRKIILKAGIIFTKIISKISLTDVHNGLRAFTYNTAKKIKITENRMEHASEILDIISKLRLKYIEVPVTIKYTKYSTTKGQSSLNAIKIGIKMILKKILD